MQPEGSAIELADVVFSYDGTAGPLLVLDGLSLQVASGEVVALLGPSGSGKSTILNIVAGLRQPDSGSVLVCGGEKRNRLGSFSYMPQRDALLPWRRAVDNAALLLETQGERRDCAREAAFTALNDLDLGPFAQTLPSQLSGGMRQRVALVRTFLPQRDILLDEPFGALDAITRGDLQEWLLALHRRSPRSVLLVTHDIDEAIFLAHRVFVLTSRPTRVCLEVEVPLPEPRTLEATATKEFAEIKEALLAALRAGMRRHVEAA